MAMGARRKYAGAQKIQGELGQREALHRLFDYLRGQWTAVVCGLVFTLLWSSVDLGYAGLLAIFVKAIQNHDARNLNFFTLLGIAVFAVRATIGFGMNYSWQYAGQKLTLRLRNEVFAHLQRLPTAFFDHRKTGQLMSSLSNDIPAVNSILSALQDSMSAPVKVVFGLIALFVLNWQLALLSVICLPPTAGLIVFATKKMRRYQGRLQENLAEITQHAEETISGVRVVKAFANESYEVDRFRRHSTDVFRSVLRTIRTRLATASSVEFLGALAVILVLYVGGTQIVQGHGNFGIDKLSAFIVILRQVADGAKNLGQISVNLGASGAAADRVFTLLDVQNDLVEKPEAIELKRMDGRVELDRVSFAYSVGIPVLRDISFVMEPGEVVAIVGPTGSGKTTIAALIPRLYDVTEGAIRVDGVDVRDCTLASLRGQIGIVPQDTVLFAGTLRDNIAYGRLDATDEQITEAAKMANAWEFIVKLPQGMDTVVGERGVMLSGGQRQRIAIARAVLRDPRILILDEATSALDTHSEALVQDALQRIMQHRTTLVIAHRLSTVRNAHKILVVKEGHIMEAGRHEELLQRGGIYSELYRTQFRWEEGG